MMKAASFLLAALMILMLLTACIGSEEHPVVTEPSFTIPVDQIPENTLGPDGPTLPDIEMPTKPDADYQLPPGEEPTVTVITK